MKKGRPPKFQEPRRPITVPFQRPLSVSSRRSILLAAIDSDCAAATVKATKAALLLEEKRQNPVELVEVLPGLSIIVIGPSRYLQKISWLRLVELAPLRFLLTGSRRGSEISKI